MVPRRRPGLSRRGGDWMAGPCVITGPADDDGELEPVPSWVARRRATPSPPTTTRRSRAASRAPAPGLAQRSLPPTSAPAPIRQYGGRLTAPRRRAPRLLPPAVHRWRAGGVPLYSADRAATTPAPIPLEFGPTSTPISPTPRVRRSAFYVLHHALDGGRPRLLEVPAIDPSPQRSAHRRHERDALRWSSQRPHRHHPAPRQVVLRVDQRALHRLAARRGGPPSRRAGRPLAHSGHRRPAPSAQPSRVCHEHHTTNRLPPPTTPG